jgi:hypothetical protein
VPKSEVHQRTRQQPGVRRRTRTSTIFRPASLLHRGAQARLSHRIVTVTLRPWRHHNRGFVGGPLDTVLKLPDRRVTLGVRRGDRLDNLLSGLGRTARRVWNRAHHLRSGLVLALPLIRHLPQQIIFGPSQVRHFHDHLWPNQCTRDSFRGEPNRLSRGGGSASGMRGTRSGARTPARRLSSFSVMPVPARPA